MSYRERILAHLSAIAPRGATNRELREALGIASRYTVYDATRALSEAGRVRSLRRGHARTFYALSEEREADDEALPPFVPLPTYDWGVNRGARSRQARLLVPILATAAGRRWFVERLRCPCLPHEAAEAQSFHYCHPLRDLLLADVARCRGDTTLEDRCAAYYNRLFGLPAEFGLQDVWRHRRTGALRLPTAAGARGWHDRLLERRALPRRLRQRARRARELLETECDALLVSARHLVLIACHCEGYLTRTALKQLRTLGGLLERRLGRNAFPAAVVARTEDLGEINLPYLRWSDLETFLGTSSAENGARLESSALG